jgi:hypothetical protein
MLAGTGLLLMIPGDFVALNPAWLRVNNVLVAVLALVAVFSVLNARVARIPVLLTIGLIVIIATLASSNFTLALYFLLPSLIGAGLGATVTPRSLTILLSILVVVAFSSLAVDALMMQPITSSFFGVPYQLSELTGTRARGLIGQPVPAAFASVLFFAALLPPALARGSMRRRVAIGLALSGQLAASLILTGTRSALLLAAVVTALLLLFYSLKFGLRFIVPLAMASPALLAAFIGLFLSVGGSFKGSRVGDFDALEGSISLSNRLFALDYLHRWATSGDLVTLLIGNGPRSLQGHLSSIQGSRLSTIDNLYVTVLWDFGIAGGIILLSTIVLLARRIASTDARVTGAAIGALTILASGTAFDALYTRFMAVLFAALLVFCLVNGHRSSEIPRTLTRRTANPVVWSQAI